MTIHTTHPFADPDPDPGRRLRGRLGGTVTLWTAGAGDDDRAGLTVSSVMVALGEPARLLGLVDPDSDLTEALQATGRAVVQLLAWPDRDLAEAFAGTAPAPGGAFAMASFVSTPWGPRLEHATTWAGVTLDSTREVGWSQLVVADVAHLEIGEDDRDVLIHRRGRFHPFGTR
jgi:flavin reductase (DIM6/NTAB) family NADH-FMN oxidoreductase RutF